MLDRPLLCPNMGILFLVSTVVKVIVSLACLRGIRGSPRCWQVASRGRRIRMVCYGCDMGDGQGGDREKSGREVSTGGAMPKRSNLMSV